MANLMWTIRMQSEWLPIGSINGGVHANSSAWVSAGRST